MKSVIASNQISSGPSKTRDHRSPQSAYEKCGLSDAKGSAAARKKAVVAVARQLAVDLWRLFTGQTTAENLGLIYLPDAA